MVNGRICRGDRCVVKFYSFIEICIDFFKGQSDLWVTFICQLPGQAAVTNIWSTPGKRIHLHNTF